MPRRHFERSAPMRSSGRIFGSSPFPVLAGTMLLLASCAEAPVPQDETVEQEVSAPVLTVYTGSYPLQFFAQRIGGERVEAHFPAGQGVDPSTWSPAPEVVLDYQGADLILLNGAEYEGWTTTAALPAARTVDTSAGFSDQVIVVEGGLTHSHGPEGEHSHDAVASVTWLDLELAEQQAAAVRDALAARDPEGSADYSASFDQLAGELRALDERLGRVAAAASGRTLLAAGPGYEYLGRRYGVALESVEFDADDTGSHEFWHEVEHALGHGVERTMLVPVPPDAAMTERLEAMEIEAVVFEPLGGHPPAGGDFLSVMNENIERLEQGLQSTQ